MIITVALPGPTGAGGRLLLEEATGGVPPVFWAEEAIGGVGVPQLVPKLLVRVFSA